MIVGRRKMHGEGTKGKLDDNINRFKMKGDGDDSIDDDEGGLGSERGDASGHDWSGGTEDMTEKYEGGGEYVMVAAREKASGHGWLVV
ncbi:hypothetical protein Scep_026149 [Stephania cephalantha]|uniref:Uncharacterized protein n=1 Tax=Stephania cephalantha TaxID=152367 RepID=A0AAP0HT27_9MAGN